MADQLLGARPNLEVRDVARSIDFYGRTLGLVAITTMGEPPDFALLGGDQGPLLGLSADASPAVAKIAACYVDVGDVDAAFARCTAAGAEITNPLTTHPWQMRDFVLRDPDGHQIAVGQHVGDSRSGGN